MRRTNIVALVALAVLAVLAVFSQADALQSLRASKDVVITIVVTPSPVAFVPNRAPRSAPVTAVAQSRVLDPFGESRQIASTTSTVAWDVPLGGGVQVAQVPVEASPVPVQFVAQPDPNAKYLQVTLNNPELDAPYGTTVFPCAFQIYTYYDLATYALNDYGYGTSKTGSGGTYPIENYPSTSYLSWAVPDFSPTFTAYWNSGSPGEKVWTGALKQAQTHCIDLTLVVPTTLAPGTYTATIQYNLLVN